MRTISKATLGFLATTLTSALAGCGAAEEASAVGPAEAAEVPGPGTLDATACDDDTHGDLPSELRLLDAVD